jgi:pimeloyl-ACP methyl ester carboxylesterase
VQEWNIKQEGEFKYVEIGGSGTPIVLLHGLMGALSNFKDLVDYFSPHFNVVIPLLPIFELPLRKLSVTGLVDYVSRFIDMKSFESVHLLGNSLGGHIAQLYTMREPEKVKSLILTGSSGLFESAMGNTFPKRGNYEYIKEKVESVFYDPKIATKALVDEVYDIVNNRNKAIRIVATAKSAVRHNLGDKLHRIDTPTLLIWGQQDEVTPAWVGEKFHELIPTSELNLVENCGHAPMMERPEEFNRILKNFIERVEGQVRE